MARWRKTNDHKRHSNGGRNHGSCEVCEGNRLHSSRVREQAANVDLDDVRELQAITRDRTLGQWPRSFVYAERVAMLGAMTMIDTARDAYPIADRDDLYRYCDDDYDELHHAAVYHPLIDAARFSPLRRKSA